MTHISNDELKVQAGKQYIRRDGDITPPMPEKVGDYWRDPRTGRTYNDDGTWISSSYPYSDDLISEYIEWGPWIYEVEVVPDTETGIETVYRDGQLRKYRVKPEPRETTMWVNDYGVWHSGQAETGRKVIITTQGDDISIRWACVDANG